MGWAPRRSSEIQGWGCWPTARIWRGTYGSQNVVNTLVADGRFGAVTLVDADLTQPTTQNLLDNYDCVIAPTDNRCGGVSNSTAMAGFATAGRRVVLATFAFSTSIGFTARFLHRG